MVFHFQAEYEQWQANNPDTELSYTEWLEVMLEKARRDKAVLQGFSEDLSTLLLSQADDEN